MKMKDAIAQAIDTEDPKMAGSIAEQLRGHGFNYQDILQMVQRHRPEVTEAEWDALMYQYDEMESGGET